MTFKAKIIGGQVVVDQPLPLADGTSVTIEAAPEPAKPSSIEPVEAEGQTLGEFLMQFAGIMKGEGLPKDGSINHDHYLYGTPKK